MVSFHHICQSNGRFALRQQDANVTQSICVFAGATSGIGAATVERLICMLHEPVFYIIGRSAKRFASQRNRLLALNPSSKIIFLEAQFSLLSDVDSACKQIVAAEEKIDYLFMSPGMIPVNGPEYTVEGLELCFAISYYCRMRLLYNLLPLLRRSPQARVVSVLNGGKEKRIQDDDIGLHRHWSPLRVVDHSTLMTSLTFDYLSKQDKNITFLHVSPGWVRTDNFARLEPPASSGLIWRLFLIILRSLAGLLALLFGVSSEQSAERQVFYLTNGIYRPGAWRVSHKSEVLGESRVLDMYKGRGWSERVWEHTVDVFEKPRSKDTSKT